MHVAIDGSFLELPPSGTAVYTAALAAALADLPDVTVSLLLPGWETEDANRSRRFSGLVGAEERLRLRRLVWELGGVAVAARRETPDLLHVPHFSAPVRAGLPLVVTVHDAIPLVLPAYRASRAQRVRLAVVGRTVRGARLVLTPSRAAAADVERMLGIPIERIRVTPEGVGAEYRPAGDARAPEVIEVARRFGVWGRYVFNVGGFDVRKNLAVLVEAFARALPRLGEPVQLVIAGAPHTGNAAVYPPLGAVVERLGLGDRVVLTGFVSAAEKLALYQGADLYVTPSGYEGFGLTVLEAMACGVPVIAAKRTSLPEVVGEAGVLVEPEVEAVAAAMVALFGDECRREELRARGLVRAAGFSWERTARVTVAAYREVLEWSSPQAGELPSPPTPLPCAREGRTLKDGCP